ncbi:MAG: IS3 family transposase, partial [Spirochaetaceae bacterium]|nr:IS3 family transposase [Spirochaetaceae bacterium]
DGERHLKKSHGILCSSNEVKYLFITQHKNTWQISFQSKVLGVSRSGYYRYLRFLKTKAYKERLEIIKEISSISKSSHESYGSRRMRHELQKKGFRISRKRTVKLMKVAGVKVRHKKKYKLTTDSNHKLPVFDNLLRRKFQDVSRDVIHLRIYRYGGRMYLFPHVHRKQKILL